MIATDLDGTLLRRDGSVSARTLRALRGAVESGCEIVVVTARPPRHVDTLAAETGLGGTAICSNGALVYDLGTRTVVHSRPLAVPAARVVATALARTVPGIGFAVEADLKVHFEPSYRLRHTGDRDAAFAVASLADLWTLPSPIVKLLAHSADHDADFLLAVAERHAAGHAHFTHSGGRGLLEISAPGVTKADTLSSLCASGGSRRRTWSPSATCPMIWGSSPGQVPATPWPTPTRRYAPQCHGTPPRTRRTGWRGCWSDSSRPVRRELGAVL